MARIARRHRSRKLAADSEGDADSEEDAEEEVRPILTRAPVVSTDTGGGAPQPEIMTTVPTMANSAQGSEVVRILMLGEYTRSGGDASSRYQVC